MLLTGDEIEKWKEEYPDEVDEVPVESDHFGRDEIFGHALGVPNPEHQQCRDDSDAGDNVNRVESGHAEIEAIENLRRPRTCVVFRLGSSTREVVAGIEAL